VRGRGGDPALHLIAEPTVDDRGDVEVAATRLVVAERPRAAEVDADEARAEDGAQQACEPSEVLRVDRPQLPQKPWIISLSPSWWAPTASTSSPSGPASSERPTAGEIRIASISPTSWISSSSFTRPLPDRTT
jgi:hypothetical protein